MSIRLQGTEIPENHETEKLEADYSALCDLITNESEKEMMDKSFEQWGIIEAKHKEFIAQVAWALTTLDGLKKIASCLREHGCRTALSIGTGLGVFENALMMIGKDIQVIMTDKNPPEDKKQVKAMEAEAAVQTFGHEVTCLIMIFPELGGQHTLEAVKMFPGRIVVYSGDMNPFGGCTGTDELHEYLTDNFDEVMNIDNKNWWCTNSRSMVWRRKGTARNQEGVLYPALYAEDIVFEEMFAAENIRWFV